MIDAFKTLDHRRKLRPRRRMHAAIVEAPCPDAIAEAFGQCQRPSEIAELAYRFGLTKAEILSKARRARGIGQYRMILTNRIRGIVRRLDKAGRRGIRLRLREAAYPN